MKALIIPALLASLAALMLCPVRLRLDVRQSGFSARIRLKVLFGLIPISLRYALEFDPERAFAQPLDLKSAFTLYRLRAFGGRERLEPKPKKPRARRLPAAPMLKAFCVKKLGVRAKIGVEDAFCCAMLCGELNAAVPSALTLIMNALQVELRKSAVKAVFLPQFGKNALETEFSGIAQSNLLKLIEGFAAALSEKMARRRRAEQRNTCPQTG